MDRSTGSAAPITNESSMARTDSQIVTYSPIKAKSSSKMKQRAVKHEKNRSDE